MPGEVTEGRSRKRRRGSLPAEPTAADGGVQRQWTAALLADVLGVPPAAVRHWIRAGLLLPSRRAGSLEWFGFEQFVVGRRLARLLAGGLSLREIDAKLAGLSGAGAPAHVLEQVVADGRRLSIRSGGRLLAAGGQLQFAFYTVDLDDGVGDEVELAPLPFVVATAPPAEPAAADVSEMLDLADDLEAAGEYVEAAEALRAVLQGHGPDPRVMFMLAELLYRAGDLTAARERYYAVIELDPDHLQARSSLGCVLAELGDHELALAALDGVLRQEPSYADAHWHVAGVLADLGRGREARHHLDTFLALAPESPWAALARQRLETLS
jgi:tetratricopeptide (TPR) repeat protein